MVKSMESSYLTDDYLLGPKMNNPQTSATIISLHIKLHVFELRVNIQVHIFNVR